MRMMAKDWALLCAAQWSRWEDFPGNPFPELVDYISLTVETVMREAYIGASIASWLGQIVSWWGGAIWNCDNCPVCGCANPGVTGKWHAKIVLTCGKHFCWQCR